VASNKGDFKKPALCATKLAVVNNTPSPYFTLRLKLMEEASSK
jgi:hypothetical protein